MSKKRPPKQIEDQDRELIQAINDGQTERFQELVQRYEKKLYNFGLRMCGDVSDTEDLVQETFLNAFRYMKGFRYESKFKNWLYRVASSVCIKKRRKSKFAPERELSLDEFLPGDGDGVTKEIPDWASLPVDQVLNEELSRILKSAILALPEKYRIVVVLRDVEGFTTEETAQILKITSTNVKVRLHRARLYLRDQLKGYFEND
jgi:RNA polymerase sigma-70 factor (ECF subfamily)